MKKLKINIHPGEILNEEYLKPMSISVEKIAKDTGIDKSVILNLIKGEANISEDIATRFSTFFGTSKQLWVNLQSHYDSREGKGWDEQFENANKHSLSDDDFKDVMNIENDFDSKEWKWEKDNPSKEEIEKLLIADKEQKEVFKLRKNRERFIEFLEFPEILIPKKVTPKVLNDLFSKGMLPKSELEDQAYYIGDCRNAMVARWNIELDKFTYMRNKFDNILPENISHPEDDNGFDLFTPFKKVEPYEDEIIWTGNTKRILRNKPKL